MKKTTLINADLSRIISLLGHTDTIVIGDMGLPIPAGVERIDLSLKMGSPTLKETLDVILSEMYVESYTIAKETSEEFKLLCIESFKNAQDLIPTQYITDHENFKKSLKYAKAVIRTGEASPYYNIILRSGVTF